MTSCAATVRALHACSRNTPSMSAEDCTAYRLPAFRTGQVLWSGISHDLLLWRSDDDAEDCTDKKPD